jgi:hypothetical protein
LTTPDGNTGTTTSLTFSFTGSVVIMVSGSWSAGDEGNTGTVLTEEDIAATQPSSGPQAPLSEAETSMTRAPRPLVLGGNGTSVSASGEYFSYAFATMTFSVTISNTTMDNDAPGGGLSVPSASLNLSLGSGSFSTDQSDITVQESSEFDTSNNAKSVQVKEKNVSGSATNLTLNLGGNDDADDDDEASSDAASSSEIPAVLRDNDWTGGSTAPDNSADAAADDDGPISFSTVSHNSHKKTTLYATQSGQQSDTSESSSSTKADIEDSSSGSTSLSFSISGFDYETTSKSKSEFSYLSASNGSSDSPVGYDGRPSSHSESVSSHVIDTLDESGRTFGIGFGSEGLDFTNEYSSNETVSDVLKSESTTDSWRLVYPTITSSLAMMTNPQSTAPYWVAGPELEMTSEHNIQFNYGGNLEDGLRRFADDVSHPTCDFVVAALITSSQHQTRDVGQLLGHLSDCARAECHLYLRIWVSRARSRTAVRIITGAVATFVAGLVVLNPVYLRPFFSMEGALVFVCVLVCFVLALVWMQNIARIRTPARFLTGRFEGVQS